MTQYYECKKCGGTGIVPGCKHVLGGTCFSCNGTGKKRRVTKTKVVSQCWQVSCPAEGFTYPTLHKTEGEAQAFATQVAGMHLNPVEVSARETYTIVTKPV
tara:strand:- start:111 stop:413 length:303 start_codon:yes stop_codon:yes gene_type:complete